MLILASGSPRRRELLQQIGCSFKVVVSDAEEKVGSYAPREVAVENARQKAMAVFAKEELPVLGADTIVVLDDKIMGKPRDEAEAVVFLRALSGRKHVVITGIALCSKEGVYTDAVSTEVCFAPISDEEINNYIATGEPFDKAGGYAIQGRAAVFVEEIKGSYSNVVGLPLRAVSELAKKAGVNLYANDGA